MKRIRTILQALYFRIRPFHPQQECQLCKVREIPYGWVCISCKRPICEACCQVLIILGRPPQCFNPLCDKSNLTISLTDGLTFEGLIGLVRIDESRFTEKILQSDYTIQDVITAFMLKKPLKSSQAVKIPLDQMLVILCYGLSSKLSMSTEEVNSLIQQVNCSFQPSHTSLLLSELFKRNLIEQTMPDQKWRSTLGKIREEKLYEKILLIGDGDVGKTTFRRAWLGEGFKTQYLMTIGVDIASKEISSYDVSSQTMYHNKFQSWDLAGQPRLNDVRDLFYRGAAGALCFFDITNQKSYMNLVEWIKAFWDLNGKGILPVVIVGTKSDLRHHPAFTSQVTIDNVEAFTKELSEIALPECGFTVHYIETSAKDNRNIDEAFNLLLNEIIAYRNFMAKKKRG